MPPIDLVDGYLDHAADLVAPAPPVGTLPQRTLEVNLRRAVSASYYAIFHMLAMSAAEHWDVQNQRSRLARLFEHGKMKNVSNALAERLRKSFKQFPPPHDPVAVELQFIAKSFVELQQRRHAADYDNARVWTSTEAEEIVLLAGEVYQKWRSIQNTDLAREYLLDLLSGGNR